MGLTIEDVYEQCWHLEQTKVACTKLVELDCDQIMRELMHVV
jgi:hypothetical protein